MKSFLSRSKYALIMALLVAVALGPAVFVAASMRSDRYEAKAPLVIATSDALAEPSNVNYAQDVLSRGTVTATFAELLGSGRLHDEALDQAGVAPADASSYGLSAAASPEADVVTVFVIGPDPNTAAEIADAVADIGVGYFDDLYPLYQVNVVQAKVPTEPVGFRPWQLALITAAAGAIVGALLGSRIDDHRRGDARVVAVETESMTGTDAAITDALAELDTLIAAPIATAVPTGTLTANDASTIETPWTGPHPQPQPVQPRPLLNDGTET